MNYCAEKYGIVSGHDITWALQKALASVENENGEKALIFQKGEYHYIGIRRVRVNCIFPTPWATMNGKRMTFPIFAAQVFGWKNNAISL